MVEEGRVDDLKFAWGKKRGKGGKKKEVQFYESFNYDGTEYVLYDCVYLYKEGESEPYIGKIVKIWEQPDKIKKVKILWFFRPCEIINYLGVEEPPRNELFLASGDGDGLANINPLEAIAGKCSVVCTLKDSRNRQPTAAELYMADFVFYRFFDVGKCTILDKADEKIAGLDVEVMLNSSEAQKTTVVLKLDLENDIDGKVLASDDKMFLSKQNISEECKIVNTGGNSADTSARENKYIKDQFSEQNCSPGGNYVSVAAAELVVLADNKNEDEAILDKNTTSRCQVNPDGNGIKGKKDPLDQVDFERQVKSERHSDGLDSRPLKKVKLDSSVSQSEEKKINNVQKLNVDSDVNHPNNKVPPVPTFEDGYKHKLARDSHKKGSLKRLKSMERIKEPYNGNFSAVSSKDCPKEDKTNGCLLVTRRPDADRSKWFRGLPWEERMKSADEQGTLILVQNLDPAYTSAEVEDIVWHGFKESCTAKMIQQTAFSSPHSGQALIIFKTKAAAEAAVRKLDGGCMRLPNGRFLVGSFPTLCVQLQGKRTFFGHLSIDKLKLQMHREMRQAVSTSHCSQPNTIEYDMALEWRLLQARSESSWGKLFKLQGEDLSKLKANLKSK